MGRTFSYIVYNTYFLVAWQVLEIYSALFKVKQRYILHLHFCVKIDDILSSFLELFFGVP